MVVQAVRVATTASVVAATAARRPLDVPGIAGCRDLVGLVCGAVGWLSLTSIHGRPTTMKQT
ncbi:hypothetical protein JCM18899A_35530 [Nocardioides sp. AN3]